MSHPTLRVSADGRLAGQLLRAGHTCSLLLVCIHGGGCNGGYFDLPRFSIAALALARGFDVLLVDRPGHGASAAARTDTPIVEAAGLLPEFLDEMRRESASSAVAVLGHSIGAAVALTLAAQGNAAIAAVAVSGIGRTPTAEAMGWLERFDADGTTPPPHFFFGPEGSYDWRAPLALRRVTEPWQPSEVHETLLQWPGRFDAVAGAITIPVALHLAEHESIWERGDVLADAAAARFARAPKVTSGLQAGGGHLYELHSGGTTMALKQLAFLADATAGATVLP